MFGKKVSQEDIGAFVRILDERDGKILTKIDQLTDKMTTKIEKITDKEDHKLDSVMNAIGKLTDIVSKNHNAAITASQDVRNELYIKFVSTETLDKRLKSLKEELSKEIHTLKNNAKLIWGVVAVSALVSIWLSDNNIL